MTQGDAYSVISTNTDDLKGSITGTGGVYQFNPDGQFEAFDDDDDPTSTSFTYTIREDNYTGAMDCNGDPCTDTATVTILVNGANDAPTAMHDGSSGFGNGHVTVDEGENATNLVSASGHDVLNNDDDVDVETLQAYHTGTGVPAICGAVVPAQATSFSLNTNGTINYEHDGTNTLVGDQDSFSYCAYDGTAYSAQKIIYIDIRPNNDAPTITNSTGDTSFIEEVATIANSGAIEVDTDISIVDVETNNLDQGFVTISGGLVSG